MKKAVLFLTGLLAVSLLFFAGCSKSGKKSADGSGQVLKVWGGNTQISLFGMNSKVSDLYDGTLKSRFWDKFMDDLAKRGIKLEMELVMPDQVAAAFQTLLASNRLNNYDWIGVTPGPDEKTRMALVDQNRLYPINKALEEYSDGTAKNFYFNDPAGKKFAALDSLENGNFYWLSHNMSSYYKDPSRPKGVAYISMIRQDWLDKAGLPIPRTLDEFYNTLVTFRDKDVNGNGLKDEVANISTSNFGQGIAPWFGLGNDLVSFIDDTAVSPWYQPNVKAYFEYMNKLYKSGLLLVSSEGGDMAANRVAFTVNYVSATWDETTVIAPEGAAKPYYNPIVIQAVAGTPPRVYDEEQGYTIYRGSILTAVPSGSKNIPLAVKLMDYLLTDDFRTLAEYGIEGYNLKYGPDGKPQYVEASDPLPRDKSINHPDDLWYGCFIPGWRRRDREIEYNDIINFGKKWGYPEFRADFYSKFLNDDYPIIQGATILAFPTAKEVDRMAALSTDLKTYHSELVAALIMGTKSLANWDSYIADLKRLGLDELIAINQAQVDRGRKIQK